MKFGESAPLRRGGTSSALENPWACELSDDALCVQLLVGNGCFEGVLCKELNGDGRVMKYLD